MSHYLGALYPAITSLINTKKRTAEAQGIDFAVAIKSDFSQLNISPWDLNSLLGNLIENAMEAAIYDKHPRVTIELSHQNGQYVIYIANNGSTIIDKEKFLNLVTLPKVPYPGDMDFSWSSRWLSNIVVLLR